MIWIAVLSAFGAGISFAYVILTQKAEFERLIARLSK